MSDLVVIVPSRGRPHSIVRLVDDWKQTGAWADPHTHLLVAIDDDDPTLSEYLAATNGADFDKVTVAVRPRFGMVGVLNEQACFEIDSSVFGAWRQPDIGFMGDDHAPRTFGWAELVRAELELLGTGIVYGNDLFQGPALPTAVFVTADIVRTLGYMAPPCLHHLFADNAWKAWGEGIGRLRYLPDMIIEHLHPAADKAPTDAGYERVNGAGVWEHDSRQWDLYRSGQLLTDLKKLRALL